MAELTIRTMRDDLAQERQRPSNIPISAPTVPPVAPGPVPPPLPTPVPAVLAAQPVSQSHTALIIMIVIFGILTISAVGVWGWVLLGRKNAPAGITTQQTAAKSLSDVVPANSILVASYQFTQPSDREAWARLWQSQTAAPSLATALTGDPRFLMSQQAVSQFVYVLLPGDPRYYVVVETTPEIENLLAEDSSVQVLSIGQWRILHSVSTTDYQQQLTAGSYASANKDVTSAGKFLSIYVSKDLIPKATADQIVSIAIQAGQAATLAFASEGQSIPTPAVPVDVSAVISHVPADASFIRTGASFSSEASRVSHLATAQLLRDLSGSYAYYERGQGGASKDIGLVIAIPQSLQQTLTVPDSSIESALPDLLNVALVSENPPSTLSFATGTYAGFPIRYVNVTPQVALDYAVVNGFLIVATSREGMYAAIDASLGKTAPGNSMWTVLEQQTRNLGTERSFGYITQPALRHLLPGGDQQQTLPFGAAFENSAVSGLIAIPAQTN